MDKYKKIKDITNRLHEINFTKIIKYDDFDKSNPDSFFFDPKQNRFAKHAIGYCDECKNICVYTPLEKRENDNLFKLNNISHGSHTIDFLHSFGFEDEKIQEMLDEEWTDEPILFLMENPSMDYQIYNYVSSDLKKEGKRPAANWYWIHDCKKVNYDNHFYDDDSYFVQSEYGNMVAALINQFKLGNAYLTNTVKCGISDARAEKRIINGKVEEVLIETAYKNLSEYSKECIRNCVNHILIEEIKVLCSSEGGKLKPLRVFAFGERPYEFIIDVLKHYGENLNLKYQIYQLPHPASREKNTYRKYILKGVIRESLENDTFYDCAKIGRCPLLKDVEDAFHSIYSDYTLGKKISKNKMVLKWNKRRTIFSDDDLISEVWIKGAKNDNTPFKWGIGYVFESNEYWYWNYDNKEYVRGEEIPNSELFKKAIEKVINNME